jgi:hypothetical protein
MHVPVELTKIITAMEVSCNGASVAPEAAMIGETSPHPHTIPLLVRKVNVCSVRHHFLNANI